MLGGKLARYRRLGSLEEAVLEAACGRDERGKVEGHQKRVGRVALGRAAYRLMSHAGELGTVGSFEELIAWVRRHTENIDRFGRLASYDTALRIGAYLDVWPERIYLHAGVKEGCRVLGVGAGRSEIEMSELPKAIASLEPFQAENFLCIYKHELSGKELSLKGCPAKPRSKC